MKGKPTRNDLLSVQNLINNPASDMTEKKLMFLLVKLLPETYCNASIIILNEKWSINHIRVSTDEILLKCRIGRRKTMPFKELDTQQRTDLLYQICNELRDHIEEEES